MSSPLKENPAYEPPQSEIQPITHDTAISIPNHIGSGNCPNCEKHGFIQAKRLCSQQQHLLAVLGLFCGLCCIPYCISSLKYTKFTCQSCGYTTKDHNKNVALKLLLTIVLTAVLIVLIILFVRLLGMEEDTNDSSTEST